MEIQVNYVVSNDLLWITEISVLGTNDLAIQSVAQILHRHQIGHAVSLQFLVRYITSHLPPLPDENNHNVDNVGAEEPNFIQLQIPAVNILAAQEQQEYGNVRH